MIVTRFPVKHLTVGLRLALHMLHKVSFTEEKMLAFKPTLHWKNVFKKGEI